MTVGTKSKISAVWIIAFFFAATASTVENSFPVAEISGGYFPYDTLQNTSNLVDEEIVRLYDQDKIKELKYLLDRNKDGIADGTGVELNEFIERIIIVIGTKTYLKTNINSDSQNGSPIQI